MKTPFIRWAVASIISVALLNPLHAQNPQPYGQYVFSSMSLAIGDTVPESLYSAAHEGVNTRTGEKAEVRLADYREKLIILDFWASWCGPCITGLSRLDSLLKRSATDGFTVIPVAYEQTSVLKRIWEPRQWDYVAIVGDSVLGKTFPTATLPHQVWIKDGKVIAMPYSAHTTLENIRKVLNGEDAATVMPMKTDAKAVDPYRRAFVEGNGKTGGYFRTDQSLIARYLAGYRAQALEFVQKKDTAILYAVNQPLPMLFAAAYRYEVFQPDAASSPATQMEHIRWEIGGELKSRLFPDPAGGMHAVSMADSMKEQWDKRNLYGYELRTAQKVSDTVARRRMQQDLNDFFGIYMGLEAKVEPGERQTYGVLRLAVTKRKALDALQAQAAQVDKRETSVVALSGTRYGQGFFLGSIGMAVQQASDAAVTAPLVDSTGIDLDTRINAYFPKAMRRGWTLRQINDELARYGMYVAIETKKVPSLVIRERGYAARGQSEPKSITNK